MISIKLFSYYDKVLNNIVFWIFFSFERAIRFSWFAKKLCFLGFFRDFLGRHASTQKNTIFATPSYRYYPKRNLCVSKKWGSIKKNPVKTKLSGMLIRVMDPLFSSYRFSSAAIQPPQVLR